MVIASSMSLSEIFTMNPKLLPEEWHLEGYRVLFDTYPFHRNLFNTAFIATSQTAGTLFFSSLAGFAFAKIRFPARDKLFLFLLATMMMPRQISLIPMYQLMNTLHWRNTYASVIIPGLVGAFGIFMMRQFIGQALPDELMDAATIDGCSTFGIYWRIALPIVIPGLTVLGLLTFIGSWNSFLWPLLMLDRTEMFTAAITVVQLLRGGGDAGPIFYLAMLAGTVLSTLPLAALFLFAQRFFVAGIMSGAFKGGAQ
jgi:ABC-type glycerol-3-phosphate transport system permease component